MHEGTAKVILRDKTCIFWKIQFRVLRYEENYALILVGIIFNCLKNAKNKLDLFI